MSNLLTQLRSGIGLVGPAQQAPDPVNIPMIRHWCEAMGEGNPNYLDADFAEAGPHQGIVAPPAMLNAWTMPGLRIKHEEMGNPPLPKDPDAQPDAESYGTTLDLLDKAGYIGVVATNSEHIYSRYLRLGEHIQGRQKLVDISEEKQTALGIGHFVTTETEYQTSDGEHIGSMFFRILKFKPYTGRNQSPEGADAPLDGPSPQRPKPSMNQDTQFFWDGAAQKSCAFSNAILASGCSILPGCAVLPAGRWTWAGLSPQAKELSTAIAKFIIRLCQLFRNRQ